MNVVANFTSTISKNTSYLLLLNKSLCRTVQRESSKIIGRNALPAKVSVLIIPEMYQKTLRGDKFLYRDYSDGENRILLFITEYNLKILKKCKTWQSNGTFDTVPLIFKQLYSIHGRKNDIIMPLVYVLSTIK